MFNDPRIAPCLWFDGAAQQAVAFYTSVFPNSKIRKISHYTEAGREIHGKPPGSVLTVEFELDGVPFTALNGGPQFHFCEAISLQVFCRNQKEIDKYWEKLTEGGDPAAQQCGWLKDRFGVSWQVVPVALREMISDPDSEKVGRVMTALFPMKKLDIDVLERAYEGKPAPVAS
jgi:predicted 3-demethylubiquinone-9 3-methyltransferase (glyoxalase superfamily)